MAGSEATGAARAYVAQPLGGDGCLFGSLAQFLLAGHLFAWVLVGVDPEPRRWPPVMLLVILFGTISFHGFFGVTLTSGTTLLAPAFVSGLRLDVLPTLVLALLVTRAWVRSDTAESTRADRQADHDDDAELNGSGPA